MFKDSLSPIADPEQTAFGSLLTLEANDPALDVPLPDGTIPRQKIRATLESYVTRQRSRNAPLFPTLSAQANQKRTDYLTGLYTKPLAEVIPADALAKLEARATSHSNPDLFRKREVNRAYLSAIIGKPLDAPSYEAARAGFAKQHLGLPATTDDDAFHAAVTARFTEDTAAQETVNKLRNDTFQGLILGKAPEPPDLSALPERHRDAALASLTDAKQEARRARRAILPRVDKAVALLTRAGDLEESFTPGSQSVANNLILSAFRETYPEAKADRPLYFALLAQKLQALPEDKRGVFERALQGTARTINTMGETVGDIARSIETQTIAGIQDISGTNQPLLTEELDRAKNKKSQPLTSGRAGFTREDQDLASDFRQFQRLYQQEGAGLKKATDTFLQRGVLGVAQSLPYTLASIAGPYGMGLYAMAIAGESVTEQRIQSPDGDRNVQLIGSLVTGTTEAAIATVLNTLGFKAMAGKLPTTFAILNRAKLTGLPRGIVGGLATAAQVGAMEYTEEFLQAGTRELTQAVARDLSNLGSPYNWQGFFDSWGAAQRDIIPTVTIFALIAGGGASYSHFRQGSVLQKNRVALHAAGVPEAQLDGIVNAPTPAEADALTRAAVKDLETRSETERQQAIQILRETNQLLAAANLAKVTEETNSFTGESEWTFTDPITNSAQTFETEEAALDHWRNFASEQRQADLDSIASLAEESFLDFIQGEGTASADTEVEISNKTLRISDVRAELAAKEKTTLNALDKETNPVRVRDLNDTLAGIRQSQKTLDDRIHAFVLQHGPAAAAKLDTFTFTARRFREQTRTGLTRYVIQLFKGRSIQDVIEDFSEDFLARGIDDGIIDPAKILADIRSYQLATGDRLIGDDYEFSSDNMLPLLEAFAPLARAAAMSQVRTGTLPPEVSQWIELETSIWGATAGDVSSMRSDLERVARFKQALDTGTLTPELEALIQDSIGLNEQARAQRFEQAARAQLAAEAMDGFPEISDSLAGRLPHPQTLRQNQHPLTGEVRALWEALLKPTRRRNKAGRTIDRTNEANAYFLPVGQMVDLDDVRGTLNERGFDFETPADMLNAAIDSLAYGKPHHGTRSILDESFAIGQPRTFPGVPGGLSVIGPASFALDESFAISAFHGTPHRVDRFTTAKIGTGEGAQAYGWGLYFAQGVEVAASYRRAGRADVPLPLQDGLERAAFNTLDAHGKAQAQDILAQLYPELSTNELAEALAKAAAFQSQQGNLYTVTLNVTDDQLLDWDKPLSEQSETVKAVLLDEKSIRYMELQDQLNFLESQGKFGNEWDAIVKEARKLRESMGFAPTMTGADFYKANEDRGEVSAFGKGIQGVSQYLANKGIRGIRFLDGNSRAEGQGSYNYVIFDEADITITEENGAPVDLSRSGESMAISAKDLGQSLLDTIGEEALRVEQPRASYDDKRQLLLDFASSILPPVARPEPGVPDQRLLQGRSGSLSIIQQRLARDLQIDLQIKFLGETVNDPGDLAAKAQALRNPMFETFYIIAAKKSKGGFKIVDAMAITSRVPAAASLFEEGKGWGEGMQDHLAFLKAAKATHYFLLHNHPSGDPTPSSADVRVTIRHAEAMARQGIKFVDHVVINHQKFRTLDKDGIPSMEQTIPDADPNAVDPYAWPSPITANAIGLEVIGPESLAAAGKAIADRRSSADMIFGFFINARGKIVAIVEGRPSDFYDLIKPEFKDYAVSQGATRLILHAKAPDVATAKSLVDRMLPLNREGTVLEMGVEVTSLGEMFYSALEDGPFSKNAELFPDRDLVGKRVQESMAIGGMKAANWSTYQSEGRAFTGADGKPRFEMDTSKAALNPNSIKDPAHRNGFKRIGNATPIRWLVPEDKIVPLGDILSFDELFENYPVLAGLGVRIEYGADFRGALNILKMNNRFSPDISTISLSSRLNMGEAISTILHEVQHAIQEIEGFAPGSSVQQMQRTYDSLMARYSGISSSEEMQELDRESEKIFTRFDRDEITAEQMDEQMQALLASSPVYQELSTVTKQLQALGTGGMGFDAFAAYRKAPGEKEARGVQARASMTAEERAARPFMQDFESYAISLGSLQRIEAAIARKLTAGPEERAEFYERLRNRLAATVQRIEDTNAGLGTFGRSETDDPTTIERRRIQDAITEARAIIDTLPPEARGRVGIDYNDLVSQTTERGRVSALLRLIDKADEALETLLRDQYQEALEKLSDLAKPNLSANRQIRGRLTPEIQRTVNRALAAMALAPTEHQVALITQQAKIDELETLNNASPDPNPELGQQLVEATLDLHFLEVFGNLGSMSASQLAGAYRELLTLYSTGRSQRNILDEARRAELMQARREVLDSLKNVNQAEWAKRTAPESIKQRAKDIVESLRFGLLSFHQAIEWILPDSIAARDFQASIRAADRYTTRAKIDADDRLRAALAQAWGFTGISTRRRTNRVLAALSRRRDDWNIEIREANGTERIKLSEEVAARILAGEFKPGWETDPIVMESLRQSLADFRAQRRKAQAEDRAFTKRVIQFDKVKSRGPGSFLNASDLEAVYWLQLWDQEQYRPTLDKHGFTEAVISQIRAKLDRRAVAVMDHLRREYNAEYDRLNPVFRRLYNLDLPKIRNYAPGQFENIDGSPAELDAYGNSTNQGVNAMSAGFTKSRTHHMARPRQQNALGMYWSHMEATEYFIGYAEIMRDAKILFRNPELRRKIEGIYGSAVAADWSRWLDALEVDGRFRAATTNAIQRMTQTSLNTTSAVGLAYNIGTLFKQASAAFGVMMEMPTKDAIKGLIGVFQNPRSLAHIWNTESIQQRIIAGMSPEDRRLLEASRAQPSLIMELLELGRLPIAYADGAFTTVAGAVAYQYHYQAATKAGLADSAAHEVALAAMDRVVTRTAQPATTQDKSLAEVTTTGFAKFLFLFKSDPRQKFAIAADALVRAYAGKMPKGEAARRILWSWMLYGMMAELMTDTWHAISRDDDDPERWAPEDYLASALAGPVAAVPVIGTAFEYIVRAAVGTKAFANSANPIDKAAAALLTENGLASRIMRDLAEVASGDKPLDLTDLLAAAQKDTAALAALAGAFDSRAAIVPALLRAARDAGGMATNALGLIYESDASKISRILEEAKEQTTTRRESRTTTTDDLEAQLLKLSPEARQTRLSAIARTDRAQATTLRARLRNRTLTPDERILDRLPAEARAATIQKILAAIDDPARRETLADRYALIFPPAKP